MNFKMRELINDLTQDVIETFKVQIPIVDIESIVKRMGGLVRNDSSMNAYSDGCIRKLTGHPKFEIVVSPYQSAARKNFTIAHELGHLFLHMGYMTDEELWAEQDDKTYYRSGNSEQEYEANEFAAAFLMPKYQYRSVMDNYTDGDLVDTGEIARYFNVSVNAASNRGKWLDYLQW